MKKEINDFNLRYPFVNPLDDQSDDSDDEYDPNDPFEDERHPRGFRRRFAVF